jgi:hypothetical protein
MERSPDPDGDCGTWDSRHYEDVQKISATRVRHHWPAGDLEPSPRQRDINISFLNRV